MLLQMVGYSKLIFLKCLYLNLDDYKFTLVIISILCIYVFIILINTITFKIATCFFSLISLSS